MNAKCIHNVFTAIISAKLRYGAAARRSPVYELDLLVHSIETESKRSYVDASVLNFAQWILLYLQSYATLQTTDFMLVLQATLSTRCINYQSHHQSLQAI